MPTMPSTMSHDHSHAHRPIDLHAHYLSPPVMKIFESVAPEYGIEWKVIEGKGPQFRTGHLVTGPVGKRFADLDTRLAEMDRQGVEEVVICGAMSHMCVDAGTRAASARRS